MARGNAAAIPPAPRKTLLEWIELDDGDTTSPTEPVRSAQARAFHRGIFLDATSGKGETHEPLPPSGLLLAPLG